MNNLKKAGIFSLLLIAMAMLSITSCNKDDDYINPGDGQEAKSATVVGIGIDDPSGGYIYMMGIYEEIPAEFNTANAVELGANGSIVSYKENIYTINADAGTISKWNVNKTTLKPSIVGIFSFASTGVSLDDEKQPAFLSDTKAYLTDLQEGLIIEWNPETMEIVKTFNVASLPEQDLTFGEVEYTEAKPFVSSDGKILMSIIYYPNTCCDYHDLGGAYLAVFDPVSGTIQYNQDSRLISGNRYLLSDNNGNQYMVPNEYNFMVKPYFNVDTSQLASPFPILKVLPDGTIDPNFEINISDYVNTKFVAGFTTIFDNRVVIRHVDEDFEYAASYDNRWNFWGDGFKSSIINYETGEVKAFTAFDGYSYDIPLGNIDGSNYFSVGLAGGSNGVSGGIIKQEGAEQFTQIMSASNGYIQYLGKLW